MYIYVLQRECRFFLNVISGMGERKRSLASLCQIFCFVFQSHASSQFKSSEVDIILVYGSQIWCVVQKNTLTHRIYLTKKVETNRENII